MIAKRMSYFFAFALGTVPIAISAEEPMFFLLSTKDLSCLKMHADDYETGDGATSFITVAECGKTPTSSGSLLEQVVNSAPDVTITEEDGPDKMVAFSEEDFACLARLLIPEQDAIVAFYPEACSVEFRK
jgi:hypothetical protein